jgi:hypothetical protein
MDRAIPSFTPHSFFVSVADKGLSLPVRRPIFTGRRLSSATNSQVFWVVQSVTVLFRLAGGIASGRKRVPGLGGRHRGLRVAGRIDFEATVGIEAERGAGTVMPDQRVWWKRASIWAGEAEEP